MPSVRSHGPPPRPPIKLPICPDCEVRMRLESGLPDAHYTNLWHMIFICDCGRKTDQLIADS